MTKRNPPNVNRVPVKQWRKWSLNARGVFNELYACMRDNQRIFLHPAQDKITPRRWKTVAWNSAWMAADYANVK